ncbi:MAG: hypothetical protein JWO24_660 [Rhodospirillales bacterium]|nr:hypothetical protein [Rhodospirillales bacterium]
MPRRLRGFPIRRHASDQNAGTTDPWNVVRTNSFIRLVGGEQPGHPGGLSILQANDDEVGIGAVGTLERDGVAHRVQAGRDGEIRVDRRRLDFVQHTWQLRSLQFNDAKRTRIFDDVRHGGTEIRIVAQANGAAGREQDQRASAIGGVVRDGDAATGRNIGDLPVPAGIDPDRKDQRAPNGHQRQPPVAHLLVGKGRCW